MSSSSELKFSLDTFRQHNLPNLIINIWSYSNCNLKKCLICEQYKDFCLIAAKEKWCGFYHHFDEFVKAIESGKWIHKVQDVSTEDKGIIYRFIMKRSYGGFYHEVIMKLQFFFYS